MVLRRSRRDPDRVRRAEAARAAARSRLRGADARRGARPSLHVRRRGSCRPRRRTGSRPCARSTRASSPSAVERSHGAVARAPPSSPRLASAASCAGRRHVERAPHLADLGDRPRPGRPRSRRAGPRARRSSRTSAARRRCGPPSRTPRSRRGSPGRSTYSKYAWSTTVTTCSGTCCEVRVDLVAGVRRAGRVVREAEVDDLRPRRRSPPASPRGRSGGRAAARAAAPRPSSARRSRSSERTASRTTISSPGSRSACER